MARRAAQVAIFNTLFCCLLSSADRSSEAKRGNWADAMVRDTYQVVNDDELTNAVTGVGNSLEQGANRGKAPFQYTIVNDAMPQAFSTMGHIYVTTGMLRALQNKDELAAVMAHEMGHIELRHPMKLDTGPKKSKTVLVIALSLGSMAAGAAASAEMQNTIGAPNMVSGYDAPARFGNMVSMAMSSGGTTLLNNIYRGYEDKDEFKADSSAVEFLRAAGYDPKVLVRVLSRFSESGDSPRPGEPTTAFHSTHELLMRRIDNLANLEKKSGAN